MKISYTYKEVLIFCIFAILVAYPTTEFLGKLPLRLWDESRQAANAIDMYANHNWLVTYYDGHSDDWNTKPPLLIWLQVIFMHLFGVSVTSLRLVSAVAAIFTVFVLFHFLKKHTKNNSLAFFSGLVLTSMAGFNGYHAARTADYDALLTFFTLLSIVQFYEYVHSSHKKHILLFFLFLCLAWLTKSVSSLLFLPALFLYACIEKKMFVIAKDRYFYIGLVLFITTIGLYYILREARDPGYWAHVYHNEIGGRYLQVKEGHRGNIFYYIRFLGKGKIYLWLHVFLVTLIFLPFFNAALSHKKLTYYLLLLTIGFIIILTTAQTKIEWYIVPAMPLIAGLSVILLSDLLHFSGEKSGLNESWNKRVSFSIVFLLTLVAYVNIVLLNYHPEEDDYQQRLNRLSLFFQENKYPDNVPHLKVVTPDVNQHLYFYVRKLQLAHHDITFADYTHLQKGDCVISYDEQVNDYIKTNYSSHELYRQESVFVYSIK